MNEGAGFCNGVAPSTRRAWAGSRRTERSARRRSACNSTSSRATYLSTGEPSKFIAKVSYDRTVSTPTQAATITVNHPLRIEGDRVYLIGHGFAPKITVRMPDGTTREDVQAFLPTRSDHAALRRRVQGVREAGRQRGHRHRGLLRAHPGGHRGRCDHLGIAGCEQPDPRHLHLSGHDQCHRPAAVGVLARHDASCPAPVRRISRSGKPSGPPTALRSRSTAGFHGRACRSRTIPARTISLSPAWRWCWG